MTLRIACLLAVLVCFATLQSADAGVVSGTIQSVSPKSKSLLVKTTRGTKTLRLAATATITLDSAKIRGLDKLEPGMRISAFVDGSIARRLIVRSISTRSSDKRPTTPKPTTPAVTTAPVTPRPTTPRPGSLTRPGRTTPAPMTTTASGGDWPSFRGPNRDNRSTETGLLKSWGPSGPELAWTAQRLGEGYASVSIADGKVFTMGNRGSNEMVIALSLEDGRELWATPNGNAFREGQGNGPRGTPTVDGNFVYALGANGDLSCLNASSGQVRWRKNILQAYGGSNITWGISESPLVDGNTLVVSPGGRGGTVVAMDKASGREIWRCMVPGNPKASYASVIPAEVGGVKQYIAFTGGGIVGVNARTGQAMWGDNASSNGTANCSSPMIYNDIVFSASSYGTGGAALRLQSAGGRTSANRLYHTRDMKNHHGGMVIDDGFVYGTNDGILTCLELESGQIRWRERSSKGSVVYADGHIVHRSERGPVTLFEATPSSFVEKGRFDQPQRSGRPAWSHPVIADGKLFLRDMDKLLVYNIRE